MELVRARSAGVPFSAGAVVTADLKEFRVGDAHVGVAQHESPDVERVLAYREEILTEMAAVRERRGYDLLLVMLTDIVREGTELLACGRVQIAERAFGIDLGGGSVWLPGVLSRKKQVVARLLA
jgi:manganese-dependent inorganic pyrophosphatase